MSTTLKIHHVRVMNFGCFADSGDVGLEPVTALIAENENGKTTFLRALAWWSSPETPFDVEDLWSGVVTGDEVVDLVTVTLDVDRRSSTALEKDGFTAVPPQIRVTRRSDGQYLVDDGNPSQRLTMLEQVDNVANAANIVIEQLRLATPHIAAADAIADRLTDAPVSDIPTLLAEVHELIVPAVPAELQSELATSVDGLESALNEPTTEHLRDDVYEVIRNRLPRMVYFDDSVEFVDDSISYAEVKENPSRHRTMVNLAAIAGVDLLSIAEEAPHQRQRWSRAAEQTISHEFSQYWQGEPVTVYIQLDETQMTLLIEHQGRVQKPSRRSSGLKWNLGFFVNFKAEVESELANAVLLLDEPGLRLHIKQQPRLLLLFDDLAKTGCTIIYSTHLGHMLSPLRPHTYRPLVADPKHSGATKVVPDIRSLPSKSDVMQPVRQVLGMGIADAIGLGGRNIIAEGWAERYALLSMAEFCRRAAIKSIPETTTVLPAGGSGKKMLPLAAMAVAEGTKVVVLVDDDKAGRGTERAVTEALPGAVNVVRTHPDGDAPAGLELEDLFSREYYIELVNESHRQVKDFTPIVLGDLDASFSLCDAVAKYFKAVGLGSFQKLRPAMEIQRRLEAGRPPDQETLTMFADLFGRLTAALSRA